MQVVIKSALARRPVMVLGVIIFLAVVGWIAKTYVAYALSRKLTVKNLELAVRLDPGNADYHLMLGRLYQYNIADIQPEKALEEFRRVAQLAPYNPRSWLDLAAALELQGKMPEAAQCLRQANFLAPNIPAIQWPIANFYLMQGNIDEAFRHFKVVLAGTSEYDGIVFSTVWKASGDPDKIPEQLIPRRAATEFSYLYFLVSHQRFMEAQPVWKRITGGSEKFTAQQAAGYIDSLITTRRPEDAYQVWKDLQAKGLVRNPATGAQENLLANGDFEDELLNLGFDWRITPVEGVYAGLDAVAYHSPSHALLVQFSGKQNVDYCNV
jgi:tetratricopeptide (TPR) repeat protein